MDLIYYIEGNMSHQHGEPYLPFYPWCNPKSSGKWVMGTV